MTASQIKQQIPRNVGQIWHSLHTALPFVVAAPPAFQYAIT